MKPRKWKEVGFYLGANLVGSVLYGVGILCFTTPHHIAPGGAGGIAALVHYFTGFPIGLFLFLFTVPLLLIGGRYLGKSVKDAVLCGPAVCSDGLCGRLDSRL